MDLFHSFQVQQERDNSPFSNSKSIFDLFEKLQRPTTTPTPAPSLVQQLFQPYLEPWQRQLDSISKVRISNLLIWNFMMTNVKNKCMRVGCLGNGRHNPSASHYDNPRSHNNAPSITSGTIARNVLSFDNGEEDDSRPHHPRTRERDSPLPFHTLRPRGL